MRDPMVDPVRGDVLSYSLDDTDSLFIVTVTKVGPDGVAFLGAEMYGDDESEPVRGTHFLDEWRDWSGFSGVTVLRRGDA